MKKTFVVLILLAISISSISQRKLYSSEGRNIPVKGTTCMLIEKEMEDRSDSVAMELISPGTIVGAIGNSLVNVGIGAYRTHLENLNKKALAEYNTGAISLENVLKDGKSQLEIESFYYARVNDSSDPNSFQIIKFNLEMSQNALLISFDKLEKNEYSRVIVKKNRNMLRMTITLNFHFIYTEDGNLKQTKADPVSFILNLPVYYRNENSENMNLSMKVPLSDSLDNIYMSANIKEVNPYYMNPVEMTAFFDNYGESLADVLSGLIIAQEE